MCTHRGGLSAGAAGGVVQERQQRRPPAAPQTTQQAAPVRQAAPRQSAANRTTNAQQAVRNARWINSAGSSRLLVTGVGRASVIPVSNPVLGDRVSVDVFDQSGALVNTRYFSAGSHSLMVTRAKTWATNELDRIARQLP